MLSVIIPSYKESDISVCLESVYKAISVCPCVVEIIISKDIRGIGKARNEGAKKSHGDVLIFLDSDCTISKDFLKEVYERSKNPLNFGGGVKFVKFDKYSLSRIIFMIFIGIYLLIKQITFGAFWVRKDVFLQLCGFREIEDDTWLDFDFALRLRKLAKSKSAFFRSIKNKGNYLVWNTRSWDKYGEWFWIRNYKLHQN